MKNTTTKTRRKIGVLVAIINRDCQLYVIVHWLIDFGQTKW
ncbi:MAG: hypothetical protein PVH61_36705 [Candidatus Aminicenantes bacterium]|jgi:hypothetical protein